MLRGENKMTEQELKEEIIKDVKAAINHYSSYDPDYDYVQLDSNEVDHIAEDVATLAMVRTKDFRNKACAVQVEMDIKELVSSVYEKIIEMLKGTKETICKNTYPYFDKDGKPVSIWNTDGFEEMDKDLESAIKYLRDKTGK